MSVLSQKLWTYVPSLLRTLTGSTLSDDAVRERLFSADQVVLNGAGAAEMYPMSLDTCVEPK